MNTAGKSQPPGPGAAALAAAPQRYRGVVQEYDAVRGVGYIALPGSAEPVRVHYSSILGEGVRSLRVGQPVSFELERGGRVLSALRVIGE